MILQLARTNKTTYYSIIKNLSIPSNTPLANDTTFDDYVKKVAKAYMKELEENMFKESLYKLVNGMENS